MNTFDSPAVPGSGSDRRAHLGLEPLEGPVAADSAATSRRVIFCAVALATSGGFLLGYDNLVISGTLDYVTEAFALRPLGTGIAASSAQLGGIVGTLGVGALAERFGTRRTLFFCAIAFVLSSLGVALAVHFNAYNAWRILCGLGSGAATILTPMYLSELAPARSRGRIVSLYQVGLVIGVFCAVASNASIHGLGDEHWSQQVGWRLMFLASAVPGLAFLSIVCLVPESPRWLLRAGREAEADAVLRTIHGADATAVKAQVREILAENTAVTLRDLWRSPFRRALVLGVALAALSQLSGITVILAFLPEVFKSTGSPAQDAFSQSVLVSAVKLLVVFLAAGMVDGFGRRRLVLAGTAIQTCALLSLAAVVAGHRAPTLAVLAIILFTSGHVIGNGTVCWVIISEIFPTRLRGRAMGIAMTAMWAASYVSLLTFPLLRRSLGDAATFLAFGGFAAVNCVYVFMRLPETKGLSLEQIERRWLKAQPA